MRAARWHARKDIRIEEIPEPSSPPPGWVRLAVQACGICGTDLEEYTEGPVVIPVEQPHPLTGRQAPLTLGHETAGIVVEAGDGVELAVGTPVAVETNVFCGTCFWCRCGDYQLCERLASLGLDGDGGLAEQMLAPAHTCFAYGAHVEPTIATLSEPLSVTVRAVRRGGIGPGSTVAVVGAGTVGLLAAQVARTAGAERVVVVDRIESRRTLALRHGADAAVVPADAPGAVAELTGGVGVDVAIEAAGSPDAVLTAFGLTRRGGRTVVLGVSKRSVEIPMLELLLSEKELVSSLSHTYDVDFAQAVDLIDRGAIDTDGVVSHVVPLDDVVGAFDRLLAAPDEHLKVVVVPR